MTVPIDPLSLSPLAFYQQTINVGLSVTWVDLTGNGNDLSALVALGPSKNASDPAFNNQPSLSFSGLVGLSTAGNLPISSLAVELFMVGQVTGVATNRVFCETSVSAGANSNTFFVGYNWTAPTGTGYSGLIHGSAGNNWQATDAPSGGNNVVHLVMDQAPNPDVVEIRHNNVLQTITANNGLANSTAGYAPFPYFFGARSGLINPIVGTFAAHAIFDRVLSPAQRAGLVAYWRQRFAI